MPSAESPADLAGVPYVRPPRPPNQPPKPKSKPDATPSDTPRAQSTAREEMPFLPIQLFHKGFVYKLRRVTEGPGLEIQRQANAATAELPKAPDGRALITVAVLDGIRAIAAQVNRHGDSASWEPVVNVIEVCVAGAHVSFFDCMPGWQLHGWLKAMRLVFAAARIVELADDERRLTTKELIAAMVAAARTVKQ